MDPWADYGAQSIGWLLAWVDYGAQSIGWLLSRKHKASKISGSRSVRPQSENVSYEGRNKPRRAPEFMVVPKTMVTNTHVTCVAKMLLGVCTKICGKPNLN